MKIVTINIHQGLNVLLLTNVEKVTLQILVQNNVRDVILNEVNAKEPVLSVLNVLKVVNLQAVMELANLLLLMLLVAPLTIKILLEFAFHVIHYVIVQLDVLALKIATVKNVPVLQKSFKLILILLQ